MYYQLQDPAYRAGVYSALAWYVRGRFCTLRSSVVISSVLSPEEEFALTGGQHGHPEREGYGTTKVDDRIMMEPRQVKSAADAKAIVEQRGLSHVKVGVFDIDGIMRGKYISRAKFIFGVWKAATAFCDVVLGWDCQDQLYDNVKFTGWHTGYPDAAVRIPARNAAGRCRSKITICCS